MKIPHAAVRTRPPSVLLLVALLSEFPFRHINPGKGGASPDPSHYLPVFCFSGLFFFWFFLCSMGDYVVLIFRWSCVRCSWATVIVSRADCVTPPPPHWFPTDLGFPSQTVLLVGDVFECD